nr:copper amine oxidase N-terminal domain-containing protein [Paenibacillus dendrobii]
MTVILGFSKNSYASPAIVEKKVPILLQINEYDVLYTFPKQPYLDKNNRLMIPLRAVSELIGGNVSYNQAQKTASIQLNNKVINITVGSNIVQVNNTEKAMDTVPVMYKQSMFVPVRALIDNLDLPSNIDPKTRMVHIESESLDKNQLIKLIKESDLPSDQISDYNAIQPLTYDLTLSDNEKGKLQKGSINITSKNISGKAIPEGKEDLHTIFMFDNAFQMEADWNTTDQNNERLRPALSINQTFNRVDNFAASNYEAKLKYILAIGRTFK